MGIAYKQTFKYLNKLRNFKLRNRINLWKVSLTINFI